MTGRQDRPEALLLIDPSRVPEPWRSRVAELVRPTWWPGELSRFAECNPRLSRFTVLVTTHQDLGATALSRLSALRLVIATSTALDYIDLEYCQTNGIAVYNTPGYTGASVAEHAFALLLASVRHICAADAVARGYTGDAPCPLSFELAGHTAGVVGLGDIGTRIARLALGFEMRVLYVNRGPRSLDGARQVSLDRLLTDADVVFLSVPLTPDTHYLLDHTRLRAMKPTAYLVNVASDDLIDPAALRSAMVHRTIAGAALDIAGSTEPFLGIPGLIMTQARGAYTAECLRRRASAWVGTLASCLGGTRH